MLKLISQGAFGCVFHPGLDCNDSIENKEKKLTKIQVSNIYSKNEIDIGLQLSQFDKNYLYFLPVVSKCNINLNKLNANTELNFKEEFKKCKIIREEDSKLVGMTIPYLKSITFQDILNNQNISYKIVSIIEIYKYLLTGLDLLWTQQIIHFDFKINNIIFTNDTTSPRIIDFGLSIPFDKITDDNIRNYFYIYAPRWHVWCLDIHLLNYLLHEHTSDVLDLEACELVADEFVIHSLIYSKSSIQEFNRYKVKCKNYTGQFANKSKKYVIDNILKYANTWDNYSLSHLYITKINSCFRNTNNTFIKMWKQLLYTNIDPDPKNRITTSQSINIFNDLFYLDTDVFSLKKTKQEFKQNEKQSVQDMNDLVKKSKETPK